MRSPSLCPSDARREFDVSGDRPFKAFRFDRKMAEILSGELRTLPSDGGNIGRWREQLFHDRLAPSVDELPQLFNALIGDMSIVGPRSGEVAHDDEYQRMIARYAFRRHMKPGLTGWAQV